MEKIIKFKLHAGTKPYFVKDFLFNHNNQAYGVSLDVMISHLPDTVVEITKDEFIQTAKLLEMYDTEFSETEGYKSVLWNDEKKEHWANDWLKSTISEQDMLSSQDRDKDLEDAVFKVDIDYRLLCLEWGLA